MKYAVRLILGLLIDLVLISYVSEHRVTKGQRVISSGVNDCAITKFKILKEILFLK